MARVIFHVDINAFFASAEEIKQPTLKGLPVAIGSMSRRSVISTANYEAREFGVHSAMPVAEALHLCPDLYLVEPHHSYYVSLSHKFFEYLHRYTHAIEPASIDECFMDVTDIIGRYKRPLDLAFDIQNGVYDTLGLNVSIGVAPNKFLAKMASDMRKPKGITVLRKSELAVKLWPQDISTIVGIGKKTLPVLYKQGIYTIGDFADPENENKIVSLMGKNGYSLIQKVRGNSTNRLNYSSTQKSISVSRTYENDLMSMEEVLSCARILTKELSDKMKKEDQKGKLISCTLRDLSFHNSIHSVSFSQYTNDFIRMYEAVMHLIEENYEEKGYRHIAIHMGSIKDSKQIIQQTAMFPIRPDRTEQILETLNQKIEGIHLVRASDLLNK